VLRQSIHTIMNNLETAPPQPVIHASLSISDILSKWPETASVFLKFNMTCIGCYMSPFDTLEDALAVHGLPLDEVLEALNQCVAVSQPPDHKKTHDT